MAEFTMPSLGADMSHGTLVEWKVAVGDTLKRGDIVAVVETDKGAIEIEFFEEGEITELLAEPWDQIPVGDPIARFTSNTTETGDAPPASTPQPPTPPPAPPKPKAQPPKPTPPEPKAQPPKPTPPEPKAQPPRPSTPGLRASPAAKRAAAERGIDLSTVSGSGPDGAVVLADVEQGTPVRSKPSDPGAAMRRAIARSMQRSKQEIPHYYLATEIDMKPALDWLEARNADRSVQDRVLYAALLIKAVALACRKYPALNGFWRDETVELSEEIHVGCAVSLRGGGLLAPALMSADQLPLDAVMKKLTDLVDRARSGRLTQSEMTRATITVTNLGAQGVPHIYPIITPPQVGVVGFGRIMDRPWVVDGELVPRPILEASLAGDHRATDGHIGGLFLRKIEKLLAKPQKLE